MGRPAQDITESELAILRALWDRQTATIRQLTDVLYPRGEAAQYATVQKLLDRMEAKGYVRRDRTMFVHVFRAVLDRDELIGRRLRSLAEMLCDGSLTPLLTHLARANDLTDEDRLALRTICDEPDPETDISNSNSNTEHRGAPAVGSRTETPASSRARTPGDDRESAGR
jgi:predicted transcriptional regulator